MVTRSCPKLVSPWKQGRGAGALEGMHPRFWTGLWLLAILVFGVSSAFANDPPQIVEKPKDQRVRVGSIATFYCRVTGDPPPQVHWRKNGKKLTSVHSRIQIQNFAGVSMLRIEPIRHLRDDATYECLAENGVGDPVTASSNLTVFADGEVPVGFPIILDPPATKVVEKGTTATLTCNAAGNQPLKIVWLKDLLPIQPSDRFQFIGEIGETLQITDAGEADAGGYECVVENSIGFETSPNAKLFVKERRVAPTFSLPPDTLYEAMLGADLNVTCVAVGSPMPTVRWRKGVEDLTPDDAIPIGKNVLILTNIRETSVYTCVAASKLGTKEINTTVKVQSLPKPPTKVRVSDVTATSVRLTWSYESDDQEDVTYYVIQYKPKFSNQDYAEISGVLSQDQMITSLNPYTEYEFSVIAFNKVGRGHPSAAVEATTGETKPKSSPQNVHARPLSSSQMLVNWEEPEMPNGQITGYKVYYTTNPTLPLPQWDAKRVESNAMTTIHELIPRTIYTIRVQAYTAIGPGPVSPAIQAKTEQGVPGQPRDFRSTASTPTSVTLEWKLPFHIGDNVVGYVLYWNDTFSKERNHRAIPVTETTTLTGLYPNTMYFMWLSAKSRKGEGAATPPIPVRTEQYTPGAPPLNFHGEAEDSTSIRIFWSPPPQDKQHGDIVYYKIYFVDNTMSDTEASQVTINDPNARDFLMDQLRKYSEYRIWILAGTSVGDGPPTDSIIVRTDEDVPGEPQNVSAVALNSTAVTVRWEAPNQNEKHGVIRGYQLHAQELTEEGDNLLNHPVRYDVLDGTAREFNVTDLQPDTRYAVQVAALTRKGDGERSKKVVVRTPGGVPSKPDLRLKVIAANGSVTMELEWSRPTQTFGELRGYRLKYGTKLGQLQEILLEGGQVLQHKIQKLELGVAYEFRVSAKNHIGYGQEVVQFYTTPEGVPSGPPVNIAVKFQTTDVVAVSWDPPVPEQRNGQILRYHITFHRKLGDSVERNVTVTKAVFWSLEENQEYWVQISASTSQGRGPLSEKYAIKTEKEMTRAPTHVQAMSTSDSTVEVWWNGVPARGRLIGYQIFYTTTAIEDLDTWQSTSVGVTESADLINLEKHSQYTVIVCAKTKSGLGRVSEKEIVKLKPEEVPLQLTAEDLSTHSMLLKWARPVRLNPIEYRITYDAVKEFVDSDGITQTQYFTPKPKEHRVSPDKESLLVEGLAPFTTYNVNVTAVPSDNSHRPPAKITVTTQMAAPQPMVKPDVCFQGGKVNLYLPHASEEYGPISHYYLVVVPDSRNLEEKYPDYFIIENMAGIPGIPTKVVSSGGRLFAGEPDDEEVFVQPYIAARFLPRAIPRQFTLGDGLNYNGYDNKHLEKNARYRIFLRAVVDTPQKHLYTSSPFSDPISLSMPEAHACEPPSRPANDLSHNHHEVSVKTQMAEPGMLWVVAPVIAVVFAACCMLLCFLLKRRRITHKHLDQSGVMKPLMTATEGGDMLLPTGYITSSLGMHTLGPDGLIGCHDSPSDPVEMRRLNYKSPAMMQHPPIIIPELSARIEMLKANDNHLFSQEYESIDAGQQFTWESSNLEVNKPKNRYANVVAYDHSRVVLQPFDNILGSDYINANYCDGYRRQNAYIATQGPLPETFADFWRMCWEVNTATIVMMTRLEERARVKCDQYWPTRGSETYGDITVTLREVQELATYCIRSFLVRRISPGMQQTREIKQLLFTAWPDHGVPDHPAPFLMFLRRVKILNPPDCGPMIVHCSAGVGRTGCFVVIDSMLERIKQDNTIDIYGHVTCLRAQRNYMVQTEDQYIFIHDAILEAIICGNTEVPADKLQFHIDFLTTLHPGETYSGLDIEFKKLANMKIDSTRFVSANLPCNQRKNRLVNILPFEVTRVCLQPMRGVEGSDYINASFVDGYKDRSTYIATQGPLPETVDDFWRMLWEHNSNIIVMLTKLREMGKDKCCLYWPNDRSQRYQCFVVDPIAEYNLPQYTLREFKITDARDGQSRTIRQFQFSEWPEQGVPKSSEGFIDFIGQVHKTKEQFGQEGPITVHCSGGVGKTGVFIALSIVLARIQAEDLIDLFQTVRILRTQRPAMVQTEDQYEFCYRSALEYLTYEQYT